MYCRWKGGWWEKEVAGVALKCFINFVLFSAKLLTLEIPGFIVAAEGGQVLRDYNNIV